MFPEMRRKKQQLPAEECAAILHEGIWGALATAGTHGFPYAVPLSYAYDGTPAPDGSAPAGRLFLHCATAGHKLDALAKNPRVGFTVVGTSTVVPEKLTNAYGSVILRGRARPPRDEEEKLEALWALGRKYSPGLDDFVAEEIEKTAHRTAVIVVNIEAVTGKEGLELTRQRPR